MQENTQKLWDRQDQHHDDRFRLFRAVGKIIMPKAVLYAGSYVDISPSFVFPNVTYVDIDRRAKRFFEDQDGVSEIVQSKVTPKHPSNIGFWVAVATLEPSDDLLW